MLSVCGSIYRDANFFGFVRSILDRASNPDDIEFSVVEDESGSDLMAKCFDQVRSMTKHLKVIPVPKDVRVSYIGRCIDFYEREDIFPTENISEFRQRLSEYSAGRIDRMWFAPGRNYNLSISASAGDVILHVPLDLSATFDVSAAYRTFKSLKESREHLSVRLGLYGGDEVRCHGFQMFNRSLFDALRTRDPRYSTEEFSFDERWFSRAIVDDEWNRRAAEVGAGDFGWYELLGEKLLFSMPEGDWMPEYLFGCVENSMLLLSLIRNYLRR